MSHGRFAPRPAERERDATATADDGNRDVRFADVRGALSFGTPGGGTGDAAGPSWGGHHEHPHPMREFAEAAGVPVLQPENVNRAEALDQLRELQADVFVVAAYGQILSAELLKIPRLGAYNLHASLLPKYRGAAPIQYAVWKGESETGVVVFRIEPRLDAGPLLGVARTPIGLDDTSGDIEQRLAAAAGPLMLSVLTDIEQGSIAPIPQDAALVSRAPKIRKEQGQIDWRQSPQEIDCQVRAMQPWPLAYTFLHVGAATPLRVVVRRVRRASNDAGEAQSTALPGAAQATDDGRLFVRSGAGEVEILELQPAGKRTMTAAEFLRGRGLAADSRFGDETE
ncbi:MAG: methionyl-tRNA formyltransferase [Planctomycetaceae bacterium]